MPHSSSVTAAILHTISMGVPMKKAKRLARRALLQAAYDPEVVEAAGARYRSANERDLAAMTHALAALAEAIQLRRPCTCGCVSNETGREVPCDGCRIVDGITGLIEEARVFLEPVTENKDTM